MGFDLQAHQELRRLSYQVNCLVRDFCCRAKRCFGISDTGNPNLFLNQQGEWISGGGDIQTLLSDLPEYLGAKEASEDGKPIGYWYYNTFNNTVSKVTQYIDTYTAGISTIGFTNNGGDDWDITFNMNTDIPPQIPSGCTINNYDTDIIFYVAGVDTDLDSTSGTTTNYTKNISGQGAGVYLVSQSYNVYSGATKVGFFVVLSLYKVDASGNLLAYFKCKGITVNSVSGLNIDITANIEQSGNCLIEWYSYDSLFNPTLIGNGSIASLTLPTDCAYLIAKPVLDTTFTNDFPSAALIISTITIN